MAQTSAHGLETDVWSLGCAFYAMLVGVPPFDTQAREYTIRKVIIGEYKTPTGISPEAKDLLQVGALGTPVSNCELVQLMNVKFY